MDVLIIGGTRNIGYSLTKILYEKGHRVTLLNRGISRDKLPDEIARLRCDRTDIRQLRRALAGRQFDLVVDMVLYTRQDAEAIAEVLKDQVGHYVFISTGQVYLVRDGIQRPFTEEDFSGKLLDAPPQVTYDYEEWLYGYNKHEAEKALMEAHAAFSFPYTSLRLPMVNSERDTFQRLLGYILRIQDGGPILVPEEPDYPISNVYAADVVQAVLRLMEQGRGQGRAYNLAQDEKPHLDEMLAVLGVLMGKSPDIVMMDRHRLESGGFLPDCSPFSDRWISTLDNTRSKKELGMVYTPLQISLSNIVSYYVENPSPTPVGYRRRHAEEALALSYNNA